MGRPRLSLKVLREEHGFTLIELLVAMSLGILVSGIALSLLNFTTADVTRITERVHADQTGRVALEKLMLALHSSCLTAKSDPIKPESTESKLRFVSETSAETAIEAVTVRANSRNTRPMTPPISSSGMNTATSEKLIDSTVKAISREPLSAASNGAAPSSTWR